jgi:hypothetical protein
MNPLAIPFLIINIILLANLIEILKKVDFSSETKDLREIIDNIIRYFR